MSIIIVVPVLHRPQRVVPLLENIRQVSPRGMRVLFVATEIDRIEISALQKAGAEHIILPGPWRPGEFARKTNLAFQQTTEEWLFSGADDLVFHPGWAERALEAAERTGAGVVGTNDLGSPRVIAGEHATHNLIRRSYVEEFGTWDEMGKIYHEGYTHCFVDDELVMSAKQREQWVFASESVVEHRHPHWGKGNMDPVYRTGYRNFLKDKSLYRKRSRQHGA